MDLSANDLKSINMLCQRDSTCLCLFEKFLFIIGGNNEDGVLEKCEKIDMESF